MNMKLICFGLIPLFSLTSGCTFFAHPRDKPIIKQEMRTDEFAIATIAVDASRRVVAVNLMTGSICAEPPPDIAESVARSFSAAVTAAMERKDLDAETSAALASEYERIVKQLSPLSQGVKFARDSLFALCQIGNNNYFGTNDYYYLYEGILERAAVLIALEIPYLQQGFDPSQASLDAADSALDLLEGIKRSKSGQDSTDAGDAGDPEEAGDTGELEDGAPTPGSGLPPDSVKPE